MDTPERPALANDAEFFTRLNKSQATALRLSRHQVDFLPGGPTLVVTFEPAGAGKADAGLDRPVWGQRFLQRRGHTVLGVKRMATDWYREPDLHRIFRRLQALGWFRRFERVMFYGPSMGGYAALAFAEVAPGCTVLAMHPQSTLAPDRVAFDQRFAGARAARWEGDFIDGAQGAAAAARVYACYDPWQTRDRLHVQRLPVHNRINLRLPCVGHATAQALQTLGLLGTVFDAALDGTLTATDFRHLARQRVRLADYHLRLAERGIHVPRRLRLLDEALRIAPADPGALRLRARLVPDSDLPADATEAAEPAVPAVPAVPTGDAPPRRENTVRRWPAGLVTAPRVPLVYLHMPKCASTTVQNHLHFIGTGRQAAQPYEIDVDLTLRRSREPLDETHELITRQIEDGAVVFTFVRDPGRRAYACFHEKIMLTRPRSFLAIRQQLERDWGLRPPGPDEATSLELQRENFLAFLRFVEANLAGDTDIRQDAHWRPQGPMLAKYRRHLNIHLVGKVENFAADMAQVLHRAGVRRIPDVRQLPVRHGVAPYAFEEVVTPEHQAVLDRVYAGDYRHLGYARPAP